MHRYDNLLERVDLCGIIHLPWVSDVFGRRDLHLNALMLSDRYLQSWTDLRWGINLSRIGNVWSTQRDLCGNVDMPGYSLLHRYNDLFGDHLLFHADMHTCHLRRSCDMWRDDVCGQHDLPRIDDL